MKPLNDQSPMPFGKFRGDKMEDVPNWYLRWLEKELRKKPKRNLNEILILDYITENWDVIDS